MGKKSGSPFSEEEAKIIWEIAIERAKRSDEPFPEILLALVAEMLETRTILKEGTTFRVSEHGFFQPDGTVYGELFKTLWVEDGE